MYNEYIQDKQHIHMNSTKWLTLTEYVMYLGREGFCKVEDTPKGWFISVIHRDVEQVGVTLAFKLLHMQQNTGNSVLLALEEHAEAATAPACIHCSPLAQFL